MRYAASKCDLENMVRVRSRSLEMAPFDRSHMSSYSPSTSSMAVSCIWEIGIGRKSRNVYTPPVFITPAGVTLSEFREVKIFDVDA